MLIVTPTGDYPDEAARDAVESLGFLEVSDTTGRSDVVEALSYAAPDGTSLRYLREPELEIPVIVIEGPSASPLRQRLTKRLPHVSALAAGIGYDVAASVEVKMTLLRILSAHALEATIPLMLRAAEWAARDPSPFVRLGVAQLLQYAHEASIADIVRRRLLADPEPTVREFSRSALLRFDGAQSARGPES